MSRLDKLVSSTAWDIRYGLPLVPQHNNPWAYMAYAFLCIKKTESDVRDGFLNKIWLHYQDCKFTRGLFYRWPDRSGGDISHDEVMGACWLHAEIAAEILEYLEIHDGQYTTEPDHCGDVKYNVFRYPWLKPFLLACANRKVSKFAQLVWGLCAMEDCLFWKGANSSGTLKFWLMGDKMQSYPLSGWFYRKWKARLEQHYGMSPKAIFRWWYLVEVPVFSEISPEAF